MAKVDPRLVVPGLAPVARVGLVPLGLCSRPHLVQLVRGHVGLDKDVRVTVCDYRMDDDAPYLKPQYHDNR